MKTTYFENDMMMDVIDDIYDIDENDTVMSDENYSMMSEENDTMMSEENDTEMDVSDDDMKNIVKDKESFGDMLQSLDDIVYALVYDFKTLKYHYKEYKEVCKSLQDIIEKGKQQNLDTLIEHYEGKRMVVRKDKMNNLHCGKCLLGYKYCRDLVGKEVIINDIIRNHNEKSSRYPLFAQHVVLVED